MPCKHETKKETHIRFRADKYENEMRIENLERRAQRISVKETLKQICFTTRCSTGFMLYDWLH